MSIYGKPLPEIAKKAGFFYGIQPFGKERIHGSGIKADIRFPVPLPAFQIRIAVSVNAFAGTPGGIMKRIRLLGGFTAQYLHKILQGHFHIRIVACQRGGQTHLTVAIVHIHGEQRGLVQMP